MAMSKKSKVALGLGVAGLGVGLLFVGVASANSSARRALPAPDDVDEDEPDDEDEKEDEDDEDEPSSVNVPGLPGEVFIPPGEIPVNPMPIGLPPITVQPPIAGVPPITVQPPVFQAPQPFPVTSPGQPQPPVFQSPAPPTGPAPSPLPPPITLPPITVGGPPVSLPRPSAPPPALSPADQAAAAMVTELLAAEHSDGWKRKYASVGDWQEAAGRKVDEMFGPGDALALALTVGRLPIVRFWPAKDGANPARALADYRAALNTIANERSPQQAAELRASAQRETGQSFGPPQGTSGRGAVS